MADMPGSLPFEDFFEMMKGMVDRQKKQMENTVNTMAEAVGPVDTDQLLAVAHASPTAQNYLNAMECFSSAWELLEEPHVAEPYSSVDALRLMAEGLHHENSMISFVPWNAPLILRFLERRIKSCPTDYAARLVLFRFHMRMNDEDKIRELEILAHDMELNHQEDQGDFARNVMLDVYFYAAALYTMTDQPQRAIDAFQKCLKLNPKDLDSIYGIAFNRLGEREGCELTDIDTDILEESEALCRQYLSLAPKCGKKFPAVLYQLAFTCFLRHRKREFLSYYEQAVEEEAVNMPYDRCVKTSWKMLGRVTYKATRMKICFNMNCPEEESVPVKTCAACHEAVYCSRACQSQHRAIHKKTCKKAHK